ncbi:nucleotidyltransferase family protein [uncultured Maribacter sp.]|uniref:nucleotidyltransferase family protein n=1 Tax=uncultured Maribacter sp. TaxID=431308 RepID=UPI0030EF9AC5
MKEIEVQIAILIMAAGGSKRMNGIKQLLPWKNSNFLLETIKTVQKSKATTTFVVLGANAEKIQKDCNIIENGVEVIINPHWYYGLGSSIAFGVQELLQKIPQPDGILICLADQPLLTSSYFDSIINQFEKETSKIIATNYGKRVGVPALFPKLLYDDLVHLKGDQGARDLLKAKSINIVSLDTQNQLIDIDTKEEYHKLITQTNINNEKKSEQN